MSTPTPSPGGNLGDWLDTPSGKAQSTADQSFGKFVASLVAAIVAFAVQFLAFYILKSRWTRIYSPKTYLVPERERVAKPPGGLFRWVIPLFKTSNSDFIQKCGLDAYLFLRYLRMLLRIFVPLACVVLPILLPVNYVGNDTNFTGMDKFGWQNMSVDNTRRYWAHFFLAIVVIVYVCYVIYDELRKYVRLRQAYMTSPQHRLRASATTVLVSNIPRKWLSIEALEGLFDVFPGGLRNIWLNRDFSELQDKVDLRNKYALELENAETELIRMCVRAHKKKLEKEAKDAGKKKSRAEKKQEREQQNKAANEKANQAGVSSGDPHNVPHNMDDALDEADEDKRDNPNQGFKIAMPDLGRGFDAVGQGVNKLGHKVAGGVLGGLGRVRRDVDDQIEATNAGNGFVSNAGLQVSNPRAAESDVSVSRSSDRRDGSPPHVSAMSGGRDSVERLETKPLRSASSPSSRAADSVDAIDYRHVDGAGDISDDTSKGGIASARRAPGMTAGNEAAFNNETPKKARTDATTSTKGDKKDQKTVYEKDYNEDFDFTADDIDATWTKYIKEGDRETIRVPLLPNTTWWPSIPLVGKKVDRIYYARQVVARLNNEIEQDQADPERYPLMNSAFIQFNHQVAAHMACQSVTHHAPMQMTPRIVEISPHDIIWENLSLPWWQRHLRTALVIAIIVGLVILWAIPVSFTGFLSNVRSLSDAPGFGWLRWVADLPSVVLSVVQGILPPAVLAILLVLLPIVMRALATFQGVPTGLSRELWVSNYYFTFLFVQVFLVVSISNGITTALGELLGDPLSIPGTLARNLPRASGYFFSYMILQALSVSSGALVQVGGLLSWFVLAKLFDNSARDKFKRQVTLPQVQWGSFFPVYTNLAVIGLVYSVISPLILIFNIITFGLFWIVYRYQTLYVNRFKIDTGGLLFPKAINQLFTGLYVMELCLVGLFFLNRDERTEGSSFPQAIMMIVFILFTIGYQIFINHVFGPLFRYIPITLEDDAVRRDEEFARAQSARWNLVDEEQQGDNLTDLLEERERREEEEDAAAEKAEEANVAEHRQGRMHPLKRLQDPLGKVAQASRIPWAARRSSRRVNDPAQDPSATGDGAAMDVRRLRRRSRRPQANAAVGGNEKQDLESQRPIAEAIYAGFADEIEDLTPDERDKLVRRAFLHQALRARVPCIWLPQDELGISANEIEHIRRFAGKHIWSSNEFSALDAKSRVVFARAPPDFSEMDLIEL